MNLFVYTILDIQADRAIQPFVRDRDEIAMRDFAQMMHDMTPFKDNPDDYVLYRIGNWNDEDMYIEGENPRRLLNGAEAYRQRAKRLNKVLDLHKQIDMLENETPTSDENHDTDNYGGTD